MGHFFTINSSKMVMNKVGGTVNKLNGDYGKREYLGKKEGEGGGGGVLGCLGVRRRRVLRCFEGSGPFIR